MSRAITGQPFRRSWDVSGTVTSSTAPVLWITPPGGVAASSGATVTWSTSVAGRVTASVSLAGVAVGALVEFRGGSVTIGGTPYDIASDVVMVETDQHVVAGVSQIATPADLDIRLAPGDAAKVILGQPILIGDSYRIPTAKGSGPSVDEIALDDATGLTPATTAYAYVQPWESGRPSTAGMTDQEIAALSALNTHGVSTHTAAAVWAVATRQLTGTQTFNLTGNITGNLSGSVGSVLGQVILPATAPAGFINSAAVLAGALNGKGDWATQADLLGLALGPKDTNLVAPKAIERPESGSVSVAVFLRVYTDAGALVNLPSPPTFTLASAAGTDRSAMLSAVTNPSTGEYRTNITVNSTTALEQLLLRTTFTKDSVARSLLHTLWIENVSAEVWTLEDRNQLNALLTSGAFNATFTAPRLAKIDNAMQTGDATVAAAASSASSAASSASTAASQATTANATLTNGTYGLPAIRTAISGISGGGPSGPAGAFAQTITVKRSDTSAVVPNAVVRIADAGVAWTGTTNGSGVASIGVDAGTYTITVSAAGFAYTPTSKTVVGVEAFELLVVPNAITPASEPGKTTAHTAVFGGPARFHFELLDPTPAGSTTPATSWNLSPITVDVTTASLEVELYRSARYRVRRDAGPWVEFTTTDTATFALPETLSQRRTV